MNQAAPAPPHDVVRQAGDWDALECDLELLAEEALTAAAREVPALKPGETAVVLADDAFQRSLNALYRGKDAPTNVLAFPHDGAPPGGVSAPAVGEILLGDVILALETILKEARAQALSPPDHICHLMIHGFLHLQGYDHQTDDEAALMESLERRALARLGRHDPYPSAADTHDALAHDRQRRGDGERGGARAAEHPQTRGRDARFD